MTMRDDQFDELIAKLDELNRTMMLVAGLLTEIRDQDNLR